MSEEQIKEIWRLFREMPNAAPGKDEGLVLLFELDRDRRELIALRAENERLRTALLQLRAALLDGQELYGRDLTQYVQRYGPHEYLSDLFANLATPEGGRDEGEKK